MNGPEPYDFGVESFEQLLHRWLRVTKRLCPPRLNHQEQVDFLTCQAAGYGGDTTWALMGHYGEGLSKAISDALLAGV